MDTNFPARADPECACARRDISAAAAITAPATAKGTTTAAIANQFAIAAKTRR